MTVQEMREALGEWPDHLELGFLTRGQGIETVQIVGLSAQRMRMDADEQQLEPATEGEGGEQVLLLG